MRRWIKVAVPVGIAVVLVSVMAIGFGSTSIDAARGGNGNGQAVGLGGGNGNGKGNGGTITLDQSDPHFGDQVTFTVSTDGTDRPWVNARCFQAGELVYEQWHGIYEDYFFEPVFTLGPTPKWTSGGANCVADLVQWLKNGSPKTIASVQFDVEP